MNSKYAGLAPSTDLIKATYSSDIAAVEKLLTSGTHIDEPSSVGETALMWASYVGDAGMVKFLLGKGADVNIRSSNDGSALSFAISQEHPEIIKILRNAGAKTSPQDTWTFLNDEEISQTKKYSNLPNLTNIFNFRTRERIIIGNNTPATPQPFDQIDQGYLREAYNEFTQQGGKADEAFVFKGARSVKTAKM